jgi:hypothetical protein
LHVNTPEAHKKKRRAERLRFPRGSVTRRFDFAIFAERPLWAAVVADRIKADAPTTPGRSPPASDDPPDTPEVRAAAYVDALLEAFAGAALLIR